MITPGQVTFWQPPYPMPPCLTKDNTRERHMAYCLKQKLMRMRLTTEPHDGVLSVVGYGPSLKETWRDIKHPMITTSGAHDFLIERGIVPDYHCDMDPRKHKLAFIMHPHKDVTYYMASVCHPFTWGLLREHKIFYWHAINGPETIEWVARNDPLTPVMVAGSAIGLGAIQLGGRLGFRKFECHGFDCSKAGGQRHAGAHPGIKAGHEDLLWEVGDRAFVTSKIMVNTAHEFLHWLDKYELDVKLHGDGMLQEMVKSGPGKATAYKTKFKWR